MSVLVRNLPYILAFFSSFCIMILELVASRLVARHVGASLHVWTSVIGIVLGGICLGNVLGGRLADRTAPGRAIGPLFALGAALTLGCLWINAIVGLTPGLDALPWGLRTVVVVLLDFLVPATVLGMIGPVVAKMAVEQAQPDRGGPLVVPLVLYAIGLGVGWVGYAFLGPGDSRPRLLFGMAGGIAYTAAFWGVVWTLARGLHKKAQRSGSALGDVYFMGAVGSIVGTFVAGFYLIYLAPTSTIVIVVAAALALLAAALIGHVPGAVVGLAAAACLGLGSIEPIARAIPVVGVRVGGIALNLLVLAGHALTLALAVLGALRLGRARPPEEFGTEAEEAEILPRPSLADLAILSFVASLAFMALEMVAGRLVTRHLGSSVYGWTSVIGVLLGGLSLGNLIGGKVADSVREEKQASWLFLVASILTMGILLAETPPSWVSKWVGDTGPVLSQAISMSGYPWWFRVLVVTTLVFFLPAVAMGTVSPVVAKLAVERLRRNKRTGTAIGQVYAWGMVGSILGTFLAGFVLIDVLGTKGLILALGTALALAATTLGTVWHAAWAGIPLGLCVIAAVPSPWFRTQALAWGIHEEGGNPAIETDGLAHVDESNYYYIKVSNEPVDLLDGPNPGPALKRTLVLDNLIHGYFTLDHPERIEYDYEFIYAQVGYRAFQDRLKARAEGQAGAAAPPLRTLFLGGGSYTFPRYLQATYPGTECDVAEIDPAVTRANHVALGLSVDTPIRTTWGDARQFVEKNQGQKKYDLIFGDAFNDFSVPWHLTTKEFNDKIARLLTDDGVYMINIIDVYKRDDPGSIDPATSAKAKREGKTPVKDDETLKYGGFLGSWVETARLTFGPHVYVFGTDKNPGSGLRETFVVVASKRPLDLAEIGRRAGDPRFDQDGENFEPEPYSAAHMRALKTRSRGIILTDDYAPVENLLAPVAATRGED